MARRAKKLNSGLKKNEYYCVSCCARRKGADKDKIVKVKNSKVGPCPAMRNTCKVCDAGLFKFIKRS